MKGSDSPELLVLRPQDPNAQQLPSKVTSQEHAVVDKGSALNKVFMSAPRKCSKPHSNPIRLCQQLVPDPSKLLGLRHSHAHLPKHYQKTQEK